jgi:hypothetical protein
MRQPDVPDGIRFLLVSDTTPTSLQLTSERNIAKNRKAAISQNLSTPPPVSL